MDQNNTTVAAHHQVLLCLQPTAETQYSQPSLLVVVVVVDRGNQVRHLQWTTEELAAEPEHQVAGDQTQVMALIAASVITVAEVLMGKDIREVRVLDLMRIQKIRIKVVVVVEQVVQGLVLQTGVSVIVRHLEAIKFRVVLAAPQTF